MSRSSKPLTLLTLVIAITVLFGSIATAQAAPATRANEREFFGTVTDITPDTLTLDLTTSVQIFNIQTAEIQSPIAVGDFVKVHARLTTTGVWVAREVELSDPTMVGVDDHGGQGADDPAGDDRGGHGADDVGVDDHGGSQVSDDSGSDDHGGSGHGSDDSGGHGGHGGHGGDDGSGHR